VCALLLQIQHDPDYTIFPEGTAKTLATDGIVLAKDALQVTVAKKDSAAAPGPGYGRLFTKVELIKIDHHRGAGTAKSSLFIAVYPTITRTYAAL